MQQSETRGFTLLEILLVVAAIAILAGIVIVAINPARQLGETRNAQRKVDVRTILSAIQQYQLREGGMPSNIAESETCGTDESQEICSTDAVSCTGLVDLSELTADQTYLTSIPMDPSGGLNETNGSGYFVSVGSNNRVTVCAYRAELDEVIRITQ